MFSMAVNKQCNSTALTVTFDTNTLASVISPATAQRETGASGATVQAAIQAGRIQGFFSETFITLEGIQHNDRSEVLGKTRVVSETTSNGKNKITLTVGTRHVRKSLDTRFSARVQAAFKLGIRPLRTAARIGGYHLRSEKCLFFEPAGGILELVRCMDKIHEITTEIARRGVGQAVAVELGLQFSKRENVDKPELWLEGLGRARDDSERKKVAKAIREWADGDSLAAHYGFGMQLFCTEDCGRNSTGPSVLDSNNRKWLRNKFGLEFVTLATLTERLTEEYANSSKLSAHRKRVRS